MALIDGQSFTQNADIETGVVADTSDYGVGGNPVRSATANYLLWSKTDKNGARTFDNPSQGDVLSNLSYTVNTPMDGYYEGILMRFQIYSGVTAYDEDDVVYYDGSVYIATAATTGNLPTDANFWTVVNDLSTLIDNASVDVFIVDFYIKVRANQCLNDKIINGCDCGCDEELSKSVLLVKYKILSADAAFENDDPEEMEKIIREVEETCSTC